MVPPDDSRRSADATSYRVADLPNMQPSMPTALAELSEIVEAGTGGYVVTCNVDHFIRLQNDEVFRHAYQGAAMSTIDGAPLALLARLLGFECVRVTGIDLVEAMLADSTGRRIGVTGGLPGDATRAATALAARGNHVVAAFEMGSIPADGTIPNGLLEWLDREQVEVLLLCVGSPKQELLAQTLIQYRAEVVVLCVGAFVDVASGRIARAPRIVRRLGGEWLWRLVHEPRRLARRYLIEDPVFFRVAVRELWGARGARRQQL